MKKYRTIETLSAVSLMLSKYFLAISSIFGWWLSITGYTLATLLNIKIKLRIISTITVGLALLSTYGLYKWINKVPGLQFIDFAIIALSIMFAMILIITEAKQRKPFWVIQSITTLAFGSAFIFLGMKMEIGWYALLIGHINNGYLYYRKEAFIIASMQVVSIVIVVVRLFHN